MPPEKNHPRDGGRKDGGVSRRRFFQTVGVTAAGTAAELQQANADAAVRDDGPKILGPNPVRTRLNVNGRPTEFVAEPATTLLEALRERCDVTGPKEVCRGFLKGNNLFAPGCDRRERERESKEPCWGHEVNEDQSSFTDS